MTGLERIKMFSKSFYSLRLMVVYIVTESENIKPALALNGAPRTISRANKPSTGNGLAYTRKKSDDFEKPQSNSSTSTFGFSPPQHPFFEASFYGQRAPPSALIQVNKHNYQIQ